MKHFLFEDRDYKISPKFGRMKQQRNSVQALAKVLRTGKRASNNMVKGGASRGAPDTRQKCVAKMQYSREGHAAQLEYITRKEAGLDGQNVPLYGTDRDEYKGAMVEKNFRIFLSPQSSQVDLTKLTEQFVGRLEESLGFKLHWQAANHYNTAHPHSHILINGKNKDGKDFVIPRDIVRTFMRENARDICTSQIGGRTRKDMEIEKAQELKAARFIRLDESLLKMSSSKKPIRFERQTAEGKRILARLENLRSFGLCEYKEGGYSLKEGWDETLKANGRYNVFMKAREELGYSAGVNLLVYSGEHGTIRGKAEKIYRIDGDASGSHAVVVKSKDGNAWFVPLMKKPEIFDKGRRAPMKEGESVTITAQPNSKGRLIPEIQKTKWTQGLGMPTLLGNKSETIKKERNKNTWQRTEIR